MAGILIQKDPQNLVYKDVTAAQRLVWAQDFTIYDVNADGSKGAAYGPTVTRSEEGAVTINSLDGLERGPDGAAVPWAAAAQALVSRAGNLTGSVLRPSVAPHLGASFGDSRTNTNSANPDVSGHTASLAINKTPWWIGAIRGDTEFVLNYGVSGDSAQYWSAATRDPGGTNITTKPISGLVASAADFVHMQYGVNDIRNGNGTTPTAATVAGYLQAAMLELFKAGKPVLFESILPCTAAGWVGAGSGTAAQKQAIADAVNASMLAFCASFPSACRYVETATMLKGADGFGVSVYFDSNGLHLTNDSARMCGEVLAAASLELLPAKSAIWYPSGLQVGPNFIDMVAPTVSNILTGVAGTFTLNSQTSGWADGMPYVEWNITANTLASGEATFWTAIGGDVGAFGGTPRYSVAASDVLQGQCRLLIDDGAGGAPVGLRNFVVRQRCYYQAGGGVYADVGSYAIPSTQQLFTERIDGLMTTPRVTTTVASAGIEPPTHAKGYGLHIFVSVSQTGVPIRIRAYAPSLRKAA
jgi:hypothetical protein